MQRSLPPPPPPPLSGSVTCRYLRLSSSPLLLCCTQAWPYLGGLAVRRCESARLDSSSKRRKGKKGGKHGLSKKEKEKKSFLKRDSEQKKACLGIFSPVFFSGASTHPPDKLFFFFFPASQTKVNCVKLMMKDLETSHNFRTRDVAQRGV